VDPDGVITANPAAANTIPDAMLIKLRLENDRSLSEKIIWIPPIRDFLLI
jgi:hypothetical protein